MSVIVSAETLALTAPEVSLAGGTWIAGAATLALSGPAVQREQALLVGVVPLALAAPALAAVHYAIASPWTVYAGSVDHGVGQWAAPELHGTVAWDGDMPIAVVPVTPLTPPFQRD